MRGRGRKPSAFRFRSQAHVADEDDRDEQLNFGQAASRLNNEGEVTIVKGAILSEHKVKVESAHSFLRSLLERWRQQQQPSSNELMLQKLKNLVAAAAGGDDDDDALLIVLECILNPAVKRSDLNDVAESAKKMKLVASPELKDALFWRYLFVADVSLTVFVFRLFDLNLLERGRGYVEAVRSLLAPPYHDHKRVLTLIPVLGMQLEFSMQEVVIPAVLLGLPNLFYDPFLTFNKPEAVKFVLWLDALTSARGNTNTEQIARIQVEYKDLARTLDVSRLNAKSVEKFIKKSVDKYGLSFDEAAPKFSRMKKVQALHYSVKHERDEMPQLVWRERIEATVRDDPYLQMQLLKFLEKEDIYEARYWMVKLGIPKSEVSGILADFVDHVGQQPEEEENWDDVGDGGGGGGGGGASKLMDGDDGDDWEAAAAVDDRDYFQLPLPRDQIFFVETRSQFLDFVNNRLASGNIYGMDSEFLSADGLGKESANLLQIATTSTVHVLDLDQLSNILTEVDLELLVNNFFCNDSIRILGYGLAGDYAAVSNVHPCLRNLSARSSTNWLDLCLLVNHVCKGFDKLFDLPFADDSTQRGLSGLTEAVFGQGLDKRNRMSDWSKRPLRQDQLTYAALDAYVCVVLFERLQDLAKERGKADNFSKVCQILSKCKNRPVKEKPTAKGRRGGGRKPLPKPKAPLNLDPILPSELKVVCDAMLSGLCKKLRLEGVDAVELENHEHYENCAKIAERDDRMILTRDCHAHRLQCFVRKGHVLSVVAENLKDQIEEVFWYFNVISDDRSHVFSRCVKCNCDKFVYLGRNLMRLLHDGLNGSVAPTVAAVPTYQHCDDDQLDDYHDDGDYYEDDDDDDEIRLPASSSTYHHCDGYEIDKRTAVIRYSNVQLLVEDVPLGVIDKQEKFYGCTGCGKMYWDGSHWDRYLASK